MLFKLMWGLSFWFGVVVNFNRSIFNLFLFVILIVIVNKKIIYYYFRELVKVFFINKR